MQPKIGGITDCLLTAFGTQPTPPRSDARVISGIATGLRGGTSNTRQFQDFLSSHCIQDIRSLITIYRSLNFAPR